MMAGYLFWAMLALFGAGALSPVVIRRAPGALNIIAHGLAAMGCLAAGLCAIFVMIAKFAGIAESLVIVLPAAEILGPVSVRVDLLSAHFLLLLGIAGFCISLYAVGYCRQYQAGQLPLLAALFNAFLLFIALVLTLSQVMAFLIAWEIMAVISFLLVNFEHEKPGTARTAFIYMVMTHIGTALVMIAFLLLVQAAGTMDFAALAAAHKNETIRNGAFLAAFLGFGVKAGMIPFHVWLPRAYTAAPSHISALMSGVMMKTAVYGMARFFLDFLGQDGTTWWGVMVLCLGGISAVMGILYSLLSNNIKRLFAYSSVENVGIMLLGIGAALLFSGKGQEGLAALAWTAVLLHALNHAVFKSLLFMASGAVIRATGTNELERMGGLAKAMPYTAFACLIGAVSITALPPFNGFMSEWLTYQSLFFIEQVVPGAIGRLTAAVFIALLGLSGALALAAFAKAYGIAFLGRPRSLQAEKAREAPGFILAPMGILALFCLGLGLWPQLILSSLQLMLAGYGRMQTENLTFPWQGGLTWQIGPLEAGIHIAGLLPLLLASLCIGWLLFHRKGRPVETTGETWTCGIVPNARMEYSAVGFSKPVQIAFRRLLPSQRETLAEGNAHRYHGRVLSYYTAAYSMFNERLYHPLGQIIVTWSTRLKKLQAGNVQLYIGYIMAVTLVLLLWNAGW